MKYDFGSLKLGQSFNVEVMDDEDWNKKRATLNSCSRAWRKRRHSKRMFRISLVDITNGGRPLGPGPSYFKVMRHW